MIETVFLELSYIVILTAVLAMIAKLLKQPLIIAYILAGILVSPQVLDLVKNQDSIATFSQIGIAFLLFMVGLNLSPKVVKDVGKVSVLTGLGQVVFTSLIGFFIARFFNYTLIESLYIAIALTFSSTIVIMKLLSDKKDLESLYGRISIGFLIVQDVVAMMILIVISSMSTGDPAVELILGSILKGAGLVAAIYGAGRYMLPAITKRIASQQELLILFSIAWCFAWSTMSFLLGFSIEIGALLAGISLSISPYRYNISNKVKPLRDFFLLMFFVFLGSQMAFTNFSEQILPIIVFSTFILIGNPLIVMLLMGSLGYSKRTGFLAGLTVAQISEFSLLLIALGIKVGHLSSDILSMVTIVGLITIGGSTYFIIFGKKIFHRISKLLTVFEKKGEKVDAHKFHQDSDYDVILIGYDYLGKNLIKKIRALKNSILVIDYNPEIVSRLIAAKIDCLFADVEDPDVFSDLNLKNTKMIISSLKSDDINMDLIYKVRKINPRCIIIVLAEERDPSLNLYSQGATYVITPQFLGSAHTLDMIEKHGFDEKSFIKEKMKHLRGLKKQK